MTNRSLYILIASLFFISVPVLAKTINLYEQPKADSKTLATLDTQAGVMTIYTPKTGDWVKVADPRNGNVGWVKRNDLKDMALNFSMLTSNDGNNHYQFIQYGNTKPLTQEQLALQMKAMQQRQQNLQQDMQKMMHDMFAEVHSGWFDFPMIMPVVMVPVPAAAPPVTTTSANQATQPTHSKTK